MPILDTRQIPVVEKLPGWRGRLFHSPSLTFGHWDFNAGSSIHAHSHRQEEVWQILDGELELTIDGAVEIASSGMVAIVPANVTHAVRALSDGRAIVVDYPLRKDL